MLVFGHLQPVIRLAIYDNDLFRRHFSFYRQDFVLAAISIDS